MIEAGEIAPGYADQEKETEQMKHRLRQPQMYSKLST